MGSTAWQVSQSKKTLPAVTVVGSWRHLVDTTRTNIACTPWTSTGRHAIWTGGGLGAWYGVAFLLPLVHWCTLVKRLTAVDWLSISQISIHSWP